MANENKQSLERITTLCANRLGVVPNSVTFKVQSEDIKNALDGYLKSKGVDLWNEYRGQVLPLAFPYRMKNNDNNLGQALKFGIIIPKKKDKKVQNNDIMYKLIGDNVKYLDTGAEIQLLTDSKLEKAISGLARYNGRKIIVRDLSEQLQNSSYKKGKYSYIEFDTGVVLSQLFSLDTAPMGKELNLNVINIIGKGKNDPTRFTLTIGKYIAVKQFKKLKGDPLNILKG